MKMQLLFSFHLYLKDFSFRPVQMRGLNLSNGLGGLMVLCMSHIGLVQASWI